MAGAAAGPFESDVWNVLVVLGGRIRWTDVAFPGWVLLVSVHILRAGIRAPS